jgi:hypothetical protein
MSDHSKVDPVASGKPYTVTMVNDRVPEKVGDFVSRPVVAVTVACHDQVVMIHGCAHLVGDEVVVHEKDEAGTGKDVRTWHIHAGAGCFEALQTCS